MGHETILITKILYYEIDETSVLLHKAISEYLNITSKHNRINSGPVINALRDIQKLEPNTTVLITMGTPCEKISRGVTFNQNHKAKIGLHAPPTNLLFITHEILITLQRLRLPYISAAEMVVPYDNSLIQSLSEQWGTPTLVKGELFGGASRDRYYFCYPPLDPKLDPNSPHRLNLIKAKTKWLHDDWNWPLEKYLNLSNPPTIRAIFPKLMIKMHPITNEADQLSPTEKTQLKQLQVFHMQLGTTFPTVTHIMQWFGIEPNISQQYINKLPCTQFANIYTTHTKQEAELRNLPTIIIDSYEPCGKNIYCPNCHKLILRIGKAWHVTAATHLLTDLLCTHYYNQRMNLNPKHDITQAIHHCSDACGLATTIEQEAKENPEFRKKLRK
jgi:hypothetical protein